MATVSVGQARDLWASKPVTTTMQNAATAVGNGTDLDVSGKGVACLYIAGAFEATIVFKGSIDGVNWADIPAVVKGGPMVLSATASGLYEIDCRGLMAIRARVNSYTSGSVIVIGTAEPFTGILRPSVQDVALTGSNVTYLASANALTLTALTNDIEIMPITKIVTSIIRFGWYSIDSTQSGNFRFAWYERETDVPTLAPTAYVDVDIYAASGAVVRGSTLLPAKAPYLRIVFDNASSADRHLNRLICIGLQ